MANSTPLDFSSTNFTQEELPQGIAVSADGIAPSHEQHALFTQPLLSNAIQGDQDSLLVNSYAQDTLPMQTSTFEQDVLPMQAPFSAFGAQNYEQHMDLSVHFNAPPAYEENTLPTEPFIQQTAPPYSEQDTLSTQAFVQIGVPPSYQHTTFPFQPLVDDSVSPGSETGPILARPSAETTARLEARARARAEDLARQSEERAARKKQRREREAQGLPPSPPKPAGPSNKPGLKPGLKYNRYRFKKTCSIHTGQLEVDCGCAPCLFHVESKEKECGCFVEPSLRSPVKKTPRSKKSPKKSNARQSPTSPTTRQDIVPALAAPAAILDLEQHLPSTTPEVSLAPPEASVGLTEAPMVARDFSTLAQEPDYMEFLNGPTQNTLDDVSSWWGIDLEIQTQAAPEAAIDPRLTIYEQADEQTTEATEQEFVPMSDADFMAMLREAIDED